MKKSRIAAIDIGSNTIHLDVMKYLPGALPERITSQSVILKLGAVLSSRKNLPAPYFAKIHRTLSDMIRRARKEGAKTVLIGATQAMRMLPKGDHALARLAKMIGEPIHLFSGTRESVLGFLGAQPDLHGAGDQLVIDSGGASTEMTLARGRRRLESISIPLGAAVLSTQLKGDPPTPFEVARLMLPIAKALQKAPQTVKPRFALLTGGTAHHIYALAGADREHLSRLDLEEALRKLLRKKAKKIAKKFKMEVERAHLLIPGTLLLTAILDHYKLERIAITERGLRDGMVLAYFKNPRSWWHS